MTEMQITFEQYTKLFAEIQHIKFGYEKAYYQKCGEVQALQYHIKSLESEIRFLRRQMIESKETKDDEN